MLVISQKKIIQLKMEIANNLNTVKAKVNNTKHESAVIKLFLEDSLGIKSFLHIFMIVKLLIIL